MSEVIYELIHGIHQKIQYAIFIQFKGITKKNEHSFFNESL